MMFKALILFSLSLIVKSSVEKVPNIWLNDGRKIPALGFGTFELKDTISIRDAIIGGYRHIDTAFIYGNQKEIGVVMKRVLAENLVKREDLFITTKIWSTWHSRDRAIQNLRTELNYLGLNYTDLALVHWPTGFKDGDIELPKYENGSIIPRKWEKDSYIEAYQGLEDAHKSGLAKSIGVSNFNTYQLKQVLKMAEIKPVMNQIEIHPDFNQEKLVQFCRDNKVTVTAYSPLGRGNPELWNEPALKEIAHKHNKTAPQVALRWIIDRGLVVITKPTSKARIVENMDIFDFCLSREEVKRILEIKQGKRLFIIPGILNHPDYPFHVSYNI